MNWHMNRLLGHNNHFVAFEFRYFRVSLRIRIDCHLRSPTLSTDHFSLFLLIFTQNSSEIFCIYTERCQLNDWMELTKVPMLNIKFTNDQRITYACVWVSKNAARYLCRKIVNCNKRIPVIYTEIMILFLSSLCLHAANTMKSQLTVTHSSIL